MYYKDFEMEFRPLKASEVETRVAMVKKNGVQLLLYKDARCDQKILDETVGQFNWKRAHRLIGDRLYCTVSIYNPMRDEWVDKEDVGTESFTEKEKGQASDSFKRACFNWGIGRELYSAPFIWIKAGDADIQEVNGKAICKSRFFVKEMTVKDGAITSLVISNDKGATVFSMCSAKKYTPTAQKAENGQNNAPQAKRIDTDCLAILDAELKRTGVSVETICQAYNVKNIGDLTDAQFTSAFNRLQKTETKK